MPAAANKTGTYALRLASTATATKVRSDVMPCTEGRRYVLLVEFQASSTTALRTVTIDVEWCDSTESTTATETVFSNVVTTADTWQCVRAQLAPPNGARYVRVSFTKAAYAFSVIVDRVRLDEVPNALDDTMNEMAIVDDFNKDSTATPWGDLGWTEFAFTNVTVSKQGAAAASAFDAYSETGVLQVQAGTTNGTGGGILLGSLTRPMFYGLPPVGFECRFKMRIPTTFTGFVAWGGLWTSSSTNPDAALANTISGIGWRAVATAGAVNWYGICRNGTSETTTDLGKSANDTWRTLGWRRTTTGIRFQVGDYDAGHVTTNLPASTAQLNPLLAIITTANAVTHELQVDKVGIRAFSNRMAA